jgi:hypothetical protein
MTLSSYLLVAGLSLGLSIVVGAGLDFSAPAAGAATGDPPSVATPSIADLPTEAETDALIAAIHDRPLFAPGRRPPAPPVEEKADAEPAVKTPPELRGRLAGVTLGLQDGRRAVFARMGEKPTVVKEGDEIDGWTVSSIEATQVVLTSSFGEKIVKPTPALAGEGAQPEMPMPQRRPGIQGIPQPQMGRPGQPGVPNFPNIGNVPNPNLIRQPQAMPGRRGVGAAARRS